LTAIVPPQLRQCVWSPARCDPGEGFADAVDG
jgi:hypothetical protein